MTPAQKVQVRISEVRQRLNELVGQDRLSEEEQAEADTLGGEYRELETKLRASLVADGGAGTGGETRAAPGELLGRVELRNYIMEAARGKTVDGAEAELRAEVFGDKARDGLIPWAALLPRHPEERVDVATTAPTTVGGRQEAIIPRVFAASATVFLGVMMPSVPVGEPIFPVMTAGTTPAMQAAGGTQDATAATFTVETLAPRRLTARYLFRVEDLARFVGMEEALRRDLRDAMSDAMDSQVLNGDGTAPNVTGLFSELTAPAMDPSTVSAFNDLLAAHASGIDGLYASGLQDVRLLVGAATYQRAAQIFTASGDVSGAAYLIANGGGFRASANVPVPATLNSVTNLQGALTYATGGPGSAVAPVWEGLELIRDPYSNAAKGEVSITAVALWNFKVLREAPYAFHRFKTAA